MPEASASVSVCGLIINGLLIQFKLFVGRRLKIRWGRPQSQTVQTEEKKEEPVAGLPTRKSPSLLIAIAYYHKRSKFAD